jgi:hypothetical protein
MSETADELFRIVDSFEEGPSGNPSDPYPLHRLLSEILYHAELRFIDYEPCTSDPEFTARLLAWLNNVKTKNRRKKLLKLLSLFSYIDSSQLDSLYRDAYRRILSPWICAVTPTKIGLLDCDYDSKLRIAVRSTTFLSITESFNFHKFRSANRLHGIEKPKILGEKVTSARSTLSCIKNKPQRIAILEDFVGSGGQAKRILEEVQATYPDTPFIFIPLIILESGLESLKRSLKHLDIQPALIIAKGDCLNRKPLLGERAEFRELRPFVKNLKTRVLTRLDQFDDPPNDEFGFEGSGALVITARNAPNNTLPLFHHEAPAWSPLFRRLHHAYSDLPKTK